MSNVKMAKWNLWLLYRMVLLNWRDLTEDYPPGWTDDEAIATVCTTAIHDDPPEGWGKSRIAQFARGRAYGEANICDNLRFGLEMVMEQMGMHDNIAPPPWEKPAEISSAEFVRQWLITHKYVEGTQS